MSGPRILGLALVVAVLGFAALGPVLVTADPAAQDLSNVLAPCSAEWLLGTDHLGRSVLARLAHAARLSVLLGAASVATAALAGIGLGLVAAWRGGWVDTALNAAGDAVLALPGLLLVVLITPFAPGAMWPLFLGLSLAMWVEWFRITRATAATELASPAVEAARLLGFGPGHILRRHVLPPLWPLFGTLAAFGLAQAVLAVGALGFISVGLRPPAAEWGLMMTESLPWYADLPAAMVAPAICLSLLVLGLQLLAGRRAR
ncbi:ABC transporter permease [Rhodovastum atsumiense]|uniref:ABC transporter permease n=1 Tax=Rhodovastum atsumiense TaxID=504468 RepID=A0A5M6IN43_9PROT|nr:ABC transporter permease [Rhodovastum atsumiense]KAA5609407.1 ABC transporter permease [Rhodovastum atsumiense]CAH2601834.1 ABC transporter permease [Rhodovastum atsumiense]